MNMDVVESIFPDILEVHREFFKISHTKLAPKLASLLYEHMELAGFVVNPNLETTLHEEDDISRHLVSELNFRIQDPSTGVNLRAGLYVESEIADEDTFALDTTMGLAVYRVNGGTGNLYPKECMLACISSEVYAAKPHHEEAQKAFAELALFNVEALFAAAHDELIH